jgi:hypothetical protein
VNVRTQRGSWFETRAVQRASKVALGADIEMTTDSRQQKADCREAAADSRQQTAEKETSPAYWPNRMRSASSRFPDGSGPVVMRNRILCEYENELCSFEATRNAD